MNLEKEIIRRLKLEIAALEEALNKKHRSIDETAEHQILLAAAMKYGTMVAPNTMELTVPYAIGARGNYDVTITHHPERNERTLRVRRV